MTIKYSSYSMKKRLSAMICIVIFLSFIVILRLLFLQIAGGYDIISKGLTQWLRDLPLVANRGAITDRNGVVLASSYTTYDVFVRPNDVSDPDGVAELLSQTLEMDYGKVFELVTKKGVSEVRIKNDVEKQTVQRILSDFRSGIFFASDTVRNYSYDNMLCQVLGFVSSDNNGQSGLEGFYNTYLAGQNGVTLVESDLRGVTIDNSLTYYEDAIDGLNLTLTIDFRIQKEVEEIMANAISETGAKSATAIVCDPRNGEILALCTLPSYNLNEVPREDSKMLNSLSRAKAIVDTFEPGSTFKAIVCAIALEEGLTTEHDSFYCSGFRIINGVKINCARRTGHGSQKLEDGLKNSCNCVFMSLISRIGVKKFYDYLSKMGFTDGFGIDFPGETASVLMPINSVTEPDLARMGFGQTVAISAMQMMTGFCSVINGGYVYQPHFLKNIVSKDGKVLYTMPSTVVSKIFSEKTSNLMRKMLFSVVEKGGGKYAKVEGYKIGGKTGTAQKYENGAIAQGKYIGSFIGFAPYDSPVASVYVVIDEPQGAYYGGVIAAPVAGKIFEKIFEIYEMSGHEEDVVEKNINLPSFIGMTLTEAVKKCAENKLQYLIQGNGDYVSGQVPAPNIQVSENDIVLLQFE